jgi:hypothetical protein
MHGTVLQSSFLSLFQFSFRVQKGAQFCAFLAVPRFGSPPRAPVFCLKKRPPPRSYYINILVEKLGELSPLLTVCLQNDRNVAVLPSVTNFWVAEARLRVPFRMMDHRRVRRRRRRRCRWDLKWKR